MFITRIPTTDGTFIAHFTEQGLASLNFPQAGKAEAGGGKPGRGAAGKTAADTATAQQKRWAEQTRAALEAVLAGRKPKALPPLDWTSGTDFQRRIWETLLGIAPGQTRTYGEIAAAAGRPRAVRAAGGACGANPIPVLVPCHRVLAANRRLGGFSGGLDWKRRLLDREGVAVQA
jgi:O-6-methylguanine DNA methyltransferase